MANSRQSEPAGNASAEVKTSPGTEAMAGTYVTDLRQFLDEAGELAAMPPEAKKLASFLVLIIDSATETPSVTPQDTRVRCRA